MDITNCFIELTDNRSVRKKPYAFCTLLFIAICALMAGEDSFTGMAEYGEINRETLEKYVQLPEQMPTHDTFNRLFDALDPDEFNGWFERFTQEIIDYIEENQEQNTGEKHIAVDGKTIKNSGFDSPFHLLHAWCTRNRLVLMQKKVDGKTNEITAIPLLLDMLDLSGTVISIDAMGAQREICQKITGKGGDYVVGLKENQPMLYEDVEEHFRMLDGIPYASFKHVDKGHGRLEIRTCYVIEELDWLKEEHKWPGLKSIVAVKSVVTKKKKTTETLSYYVSSLEANPERLLSIIRNHWQVENNLHWVLDCSFNEDDACIRRENAALNMSTGRKLALNILSTLKDEKTSLKSMQRRCWNPSNVVKFLIKFIHA